MTLKEKISNYTFIPVKNLEKLAEGHMKFDTSVQMKMKNGMTKEMFINYWIVISFVEKNNMWYELTDNPDTPIKEGSLDQVYNICAKHYNKSSEELEEGFLACFGLKYYDEDKRNLIKNNIIEKGLTLESKLKKRGLL